jgi:hypothetical protein
MAKNVLETFIDVLQNVKGIIIYPVWIQKQFWLLQDYNKVPLGNRWEICLSMREQNEPRNACLQKGAIV